MIATTHPGQVITGIVSYHTAQLKNAFGNLHEKYPQLAIHEYQQPTSVGIVGLVPTQVTNEGGAIQRGDELISSSTPGRAMKGTALSPRRVVGIALGTCDAISCVINVQR